MPRTRGPKDLLSSKECDTLPVGRHHDGAGLYLVVNETRSGGRSRAWLFTWTSKGRRREMGLGSYGNDGGRVSLSRARALAEEQRKLVAQGRDPIAERKAAKVEQRRQAASELTFGQCADKLFADLSVDVTRSTSSSGPTACATMPQRCVICPSPRLRPRTCLP